MGEDGLQNCEPEIMQEWFGGVDRMNLLKKFLQDLTGLGVATIIITYGIPKLVKILLDKNGFLDSRLGIKGIFGCVRPGILYNKGQALISIYETMCSTSFVEHKHEIVFADDSRSNIDAIDRECDLPEGHNIFIDKTTAMTHEHFEKVIDIYKKLSSKQSSSETHEHASMISTNLPVVHDDNIDDGTPMISQSPRSPSESRRLSVSGR